MRRHFFGVAAGAALLLITPAQAATTAPGVTTGGVTAITPTSATLHGVVNPHGSKTTYYFEIGDKAGHYTSTTGPTDAGAGTARVAVTADVAGLTPFTSYHYRLIASNAKGIVRGADRAFKTAKQPLAFNLGADHNPAPYRSSITLLGQLTGTGNANRGVQIQSKAFPYTADWVNVGSPVLTNDQGIFTLPVLSLLVSTQFRAVTTEKPIAASNPVLVASSVLVSLHASTRHVFYGHRIRFHGTVTPPEAGSLYYLQRLRNGEWVNVKGGVVKPGGDTSSTYSKRVHIKHAGHYRVLVGVNNQNTSGLSREIPIHLKKHKH